MIKSIKNFFLSFSVIFFIAAVTSFTAFNWKLMNSFQKLSVPACLIILGLCFYIFLKETKYKNLSLFFSCFIIGTLFAVYGQVYQTGANTWILFRNWAFFLIIPLFISASYNIAILLIAVISFAAYFGLSLYFSSMYALFFATLISGGILILYPIFIKKLNLEFNDFFYNTILIPFYIIFNIAGVFLVFSNSILKFIYPFTLILIFLVAYKIYKKVIILPFSIISTGLCVWALFSKNRFFSFFGFTIYFIISLLIFNVTLTLLIKNTPTFENKFIRQIFKTIRNSLKFFILFSSLGLFISIVFLRGNEKIGFLLLGLISVVTSFILPKILDFKESNLEIISFSLGLISLNYFFIETLYLKDIENFIFILSSINIIIYYLVWYFRINKVMDLLFASLSYIYLAICLHEFVIQDKEFSLFLLPNIINIIGILVLPLQLIFEDKINKLNFKDRINRIFYGNNIGLLITFYSPFSFIQSLSAYYSEDFKIKNFMENFSIYLKLESILLLILFIFIIFYALKKDKKILEQKNLKNTLILSVIFIGIWYIAGYIPYLRYPILLILLYTYKKNRWNTTILYIAICYFIFYYYYSMYNITLLKKSYYMMATALILLSAYIISKFFIKEDKEVIKNEN
ncbi:MAG: DUF4401 domain-containing protein [Fusobacterium gastrosuis]|uniref:DUF4401 domain-containing protein n=1 Tax=Fusobacterium gastrosuis TaxID=1755100 RepID=UPI002A934A80|nr:DUF4401 domain-containing protein [Fusobacteriaceae bacterium]MDY5794526.1 DUF4401 domain-containing protein [Fusobacterium gastrosuis]